MYIIRAWDNDLVFGYLCKDAAGDYEFSDQSFAVKYETRKDAEHAIEKINKSVFSNLKFCIVETKGE